MGKGQELHAFACGRIIFELNTRKVPIFPFPLALVHSFRVTYHAADVSVCLFTFLAHITQKHAGGSC